mmetsp:Transcript_39862/g.79747  ORF Transcript_39862/g.79747 Transcript_39862/m.79747 type:complete len:213 (-) Transcript_39862:776-1414(-)
MQDGSRVCMWAITKTSPRMTPAGAASSLTTGRPPARAAATPSASTSPAGRTTRRLVRAPTFTLSSACRSCSISTSSSRGCTTRQSSSTSTRRSTDAPRHASSFLRSAPSRPASFSPPASTPSLEHTLSLTTPAALPGLSFASFGVSTFSTSPSRTTASTCTSVCGRGSPLRCGWSESALIRMSRSAAANMHSIPTLLSASSYRRAISPRSIR